jgi:PmbA protein
MDPKEFIRDIVQFCLRAGATAAEVLVREGREFSTTVRLGAVEKLSQASFHKVGVRLFRGNRSALFAASDLSLPGIRELALDALAMASAAGEDSFMGLPELADYGHSAPLPAICCASETGLSVDDRIVLARQCEEAALSCDPRVRNSEGATFANSITHVAYGNSLGIEGEYSKSQYSLSVVSLAESDGRKQRDFWLSIGPDFAMLLRPEEVGKKSASRTLRRLGARKLPTCAVPVLFDPLASASFLKHIATAASGTALLRKASFLLNRLGGRVASPLVTIIDDGIFEGGLGSRAFDCEGVPSRKTVVVRKGVLESYLLDSYAARKLGMRTTGNSNRELHGGLSSGPSNFYVEPGQCSVDELISSIQKGLLVTELIGFGVDTVSGNYSQGAFGIWIENGCLTHPVEGITIAGNLREMLTSIEAVGNDPEMQDEVFAPSLLIGKMVVSGS